MRKLWIALALAALAVPALAQTYNSGTCFSPSMGVAVIGGAPYIHTGDTITAQCEVQNETGGPVTATAVLSLTPPGSSTPVMTVSRSVFFVVNLEKANVALSYTVPCPAGPTGYWTLKGTIAGCTSYQLPVTAQVYVAPQPFCP